MERNRPAGPVRARRQIVRPYGYDKRIAYDDIRLVEGDGSLSDVIVQVFTNPHTEFALVRNVLSGCYSFSVHRA
jgi:hypothetical protein